MLVILPPSETKRDGGDEGRSLDVSSLRFPALAPERRAALAALRRTSRSVEVSTRALGLGPLQRSEIDRNRAVLGSPVMPVMDRFTGVLFEALDAAGLDSGARSWLAGNVVVHSALFGLVGAADDIPAYRLSHDSRPVDLILKKHWREPIAAVLAEQPGLILDLRSEGYVALGPLPERDDAVGIRVVTAASDGTKRALNHFNKKGKGEFVRALAQAGIEHANIGSLITWAAGAGIRIEPSDSIPGRRMVDLVV